jgi:hypothetical protein
LKNQELRLLGNEWPQLLILAYERWNTLVMPGLDPGIHQNEKFSQETRNRDGLPGQARQ